MRRLRRILVWMIGIMIFLAAFGYWQGQRLLNQLAITDLHWTLHEPGFTQLQLAHLSFTTHQTDVVLTVTADDLHLQWHWDGFIPRVTSATANNALAIVNHKPRSAPKETTEFALPDDWRLPEALPEYIFVKRLEADLPCATGRCTIVTQVRGQWLQDMFSLQLQTRNTPDAVNLDITYTSSANQPALRFALVAPNLIQLNGNTRLSPDENWLGDLQLNLQPPAESWVDYLQRWYAFDVAAIGAGNVQFSGMANLQLNSETLDFEISEGEVQVTAAEWSPVAAMKLTNINITQKFTAQWQPDFLSYSLLEAGEVYADITGADFSITGGKINLQELTFSGAPASWLDGELHGKASLSVARLEQAQIHPQPWNWQGEIKAGEGQARLQGKLTANNSLTLEHTLTADKNRWQLEWQLPDIFLLAGNSLQLLTPHWPPLLTLQRGRLNGEGIFSGSWGEKKPASGATSSDIAKASPVTGEARIRLVEVAGIYDTTAFVGVSGEVNLLLAADSFAVASDNLTANEIVQGFTLGPARSALTYTATLANPVNGKLRIDLLQSALLGGSVAIPATTLDFAQPTEQLLQIDITEIDLAQLLAEHPSSDLTGTGIISGRVPLTISAAGISVNGGQLAARPPGGQLQYRSARAADLATSAQGMKIITDALDDFHYTLLSSDVSYDTNGKLLLGVRLEGKNPAVQDGRPINFNINLEEDLPAMIFSLQLTNQLNDIIKKRVQEKMRSRPAP